MAQDNNQHDRLLADLRPFLDPATELRVSIGTNQNEHEFEFHRQETLYYGRTIENPDGPLSVQIRAPSKSRTYNDFRSFLCSPEVADIEALCRYQRSILRKEQSITNWVDGDAQMGDVNMNWDPPRRSSEAMRDFLDETDSNRTRVLVIDGPAGIGKTWLLNKLCLERAERIIERKGGSPMLVVSSRGRRLSRLYDAIAASAQDIRSRISYWEVAPLVRHQVLTLAIDGFDELAYAEGYRDAWANLESLLTDLDGRGVLIIAARDTFFHDQQLLRTFEMAQNLRQETLQIKYLRLRPWRLSHVRTFLGQRQPPLPEDRVSAVLDLLRDGRMPLLERPLFVKLLSDHLAKDGDIESASYYRVMIDSFVQREAVRIFSAHFGTTQATSLPTIPKEYSELLTQFFKELSAEMFAQEALSLDIETIRTYLEVFLEQSHLVSHDMRKAILHRASSIGFMDRISDGGRERRQFPHESVYFSFLAEYMLDEFRERNRFEALLRRGVLSPDMRDAIVEAVERRDDDEAFSLEKLLAWVCNRLPDVPESGALKTNLGAFLMALLSSRDASELPPTTISDEHFDAVSLAEARCQLLLINCSFKFLDASSADLSRVEFSNKGEKPVVISRLRVDEYTTMGQWLPSVSVLDIASASRPLKTLRIPDEIRSHLASLQRGRDLNSQPSRGERLLYSLTKLWTRKFFLDENEIREDRYYVDVVWEKLLDTLTQYNRLRIEDKYSMGGKLRNLYRLKDPVAILARRHEDSDVQQQIDKLWSDVHQIV